MNTIITTARPTPIKLPNNFIIQNNRNNIILKITSAILASYCSSEKEELDGASLYL